MSRLAFSLITKVFCMWWCFFSSFLLLFFPLISISLQRARITQWFWAWTLEVSCSGPFQALSLTSDGLCQSLNLSVPQRPMDGDDNHTHLRGLSGWSEYLWDTSSSSWQRVRTVYKNTHNFLRSPATKSDCFLASLLLPVTRADFLCKCHESMFLTQLHLLSC